MLDHTSINGIMPRCNVPVMVVAEWDVTTMMLDRSELNGMMPTLFADNPATAESRSMGIWSMRKRAWTGSTGPCYKPKLWMAMRPSTFAASRDRETRSTCSSRPTLTRCRGSSRKFLQEPRSRNRLPPDPVISQLRREQGWRRPPTKVPVCCSLK